MLSKLLLAVCVLSTVFLFADNQPQIPGREELERAFIARLTKADLVGTFSVVGKTGPKDERYEIETVEKLKGDDWVITARMKYA